MKLFALYLPQFHEIPENNHWWGKGFTEWTNVRNAVPLFKGHSQPKVPLHNNYYNLMDKKTVVWQTNLMHKYGIDGMIYYHYYFCGKKLLEKPAENLLKWTDINQPFFFCWANHTWNRAWKGSKQVLIEQMYGNREDWEKHFEYLLPFFKDSRYEKVDNKPVFMIYNTKFTEKDALVDCFNNLSIKNGFGGIYVIEECIATSKRMIRDAIASSLKVNANRIFMAEPLNSLVISGYKRDYMRVMTWLRKIGLIKSVRKISGEKLYQKLIATKWYDKNIIHGIFFEWDNTSRHGRRGYVITPPTHETFVKYVSKLRDSDYVFVNAWNEWAEGMILEPTEENGTKYLEWLKEIKNTI